MRKLNKLFGLLLVFVLGMFLASTINVMAAESTTVVAKYPGGATINMVEGNNAEALGLDPSIFNVTANKNKPQQNIGLNTDGSIRLYANRADGNGNTLEISTLGDQIITSIKITYLAGSNTVEGETSGLITFGNAEGIVLQLADIQNTTKEYTGLNVESFTIKNTTTGTKTGQIWISEIEITYQSTQEPLIKSLEGASIRTLGVQGLRFDAKVLNIEAIKEKGFYLIFGKASVDDLNEAILNKDGETIILNGKEVFRKAVPGRTLKDEFSIVLTGIPGRGYLDNITVIPYAVGHDDVEMLVSPVTRSIGEVAIKMAQKGEELPKGVQDVLDSIEANVVRVGFIGENLEVAKGMKDDNDEYVDLELYDVYHPETTEEITLPIPEDKPGFTFGGWYDNDSYTGSPVASITIAEVNEPVLLYAKWEVIEEDEELLYSIDFEGGTEGSYLRNVDTTLGVEGGLNWHIATKSTSSSGVLWNYNASQDTNITDEQGLNIARLDGRNETTITSDAISNVTKLVFDAKFYGTRTNSNLKVQIKVGDGEFVDAFTVNLASTFNTFTVNINEENVQIRFVATGERSNLDNIRIYG